MASFIPLIRAAALMPWVRWLGENGRPVLDRLRAADLGFLPFDDPNRPVPALNAIAFGKLQGRLEGCDIGMRVVSAATLLDIENLGITALRENTVGDALRSMAKVMPRHCTHEVVTVEERPGGLLFSEYWHREIDPESLHMVEQYVAAIVQSLCGLSGIDGPYFESLRLVPHPQHGLKHIEDHFGLAAEPSDRPRLEVLVPRRVAQAKLAGSSAGKTGTGPSANDWHRLRNEASLSASADVVVEAMLGDGVPTVDRLALAAGTSVRGLQRQLAQEGTSFSALLDQVRLRILKRRLEEGSVNLGRLSAELGYANPPAFSRAVRRWTGKPPRELLGR